MNEKYTPTIGLEIHAELKTKTKMFCDSPNNPDEKEPNKNICPVCTGQPGTLPTINKEAVKKVLKVGLAIGGEIAGFSEFDRKNYFYPDIPKGYQISQYKFPLVKKGGLVNVAITRVHLEEDTARSSHVAEEKYSLVDFNRAGIPLMELVTEPVIKSAKEAVVFAKELRLLLRYLNISDANMEKGHMRIEANISVSDSDEFGTKVEVKNLNSFRSVEKAINFEINRHIKVLERGEEIVQETRGWNEVEEKTFSQRIKEGSDDYRYFPEPDLPKLDISLVPEFSRETLEKELLELPSERRIRYREIGEIDPAHIEMLVNNPLYGDLFDATCKQQSKFYKLTANYIASDIVGLVSKLGEEGLKNITPKNLSELISMFATNKISSSGATSVLTYMFNNGGSPDEIAKEKNLFQINDEKELESLIQKVIDSNENIVEEYKKGKSSSLEYLIGQTMKESKGKANPKIARETLLEKLR